MHPLTLPVGAHGDKGVCQCPFSLELKRSFSPYGLAVLSLIILLGLPPLQATVAQPAVLFCAATSVGSLARVRLFVEAYQNDDSSRLTIIN